jgi:molybdenum cofactor synthesis domain-containing protein
MRVGVITVSDRAYAGEYEDGSGPVIIDKLKSIDVAVEMRAVVPDNASMLRAALYSLVDDAGLDVIITTGGTGLSPYDMTPEVTASVLDREVPGIATALVVGGLARTQHAMLSRGIAGVRKRTLIINLPGSPKAAAEGMDILLPVLGHAIDMIAGKGH